LSLREAIAESCDTCFYKLVGGFTDFPTPLGVTLESDYSRLFGYGALSGIDLPGEAAGLVPDPKWKQRTKNEQWVTGDTYNMAIGQGFVLATPLQVLDMTAIVANGGTLYRPHFGLEIVNAEGTLTNTIATQVIRKLPIDPKYFQIVRDGMRGAVTHGTAWHANLAQVAVAGKTGTAEYYGPLVNGHLPEHAWFTAFAPFDKPQIALVVFVAGGGEGSEVAAPIAADILRAYFNIPEDTPLANTTAPPPPPESRAPKPDSPAAAPSHKFVGHVAQINDNTGVERPSIGGKVLDAFGKPLAGISLVLDPGNGKNVQTATTGSDGSFNFADVNDQLATRWFVRVTAPGDSEALAVDVAPQKSYDVVFNATSQ
jgi:penicillin-binding protein 2